MRANEETCEIRVGRETISLSPRVYCRSYLARAFPTSAYLIPVPYFSLEILLRPTSSLFTATNNITRK